MRGLPFFKPKKGAQFAGLGFSDGSGGGSYVLPTASADTLGGVKVGNNLSIDENGTLSGSAPYTLPIASASTLGGVKVGKNLGIDASGILSTKPEFKELTDEESSHVLSGSYYDIKLYVFSVNTSIPGIPGGFNFVLAYGDETDGYGFQFLISYSGHILFRCVENHIWQSWQEVAFTS